MSRLWFFLWLALLLAQLLTIWSRRSPTDNALPLTGMPAHELGRLSEEMQRTWELLGPPTRSVEETLPGDRFGDPLLQREGWLLELRDAEKELLSNGTESRITMDLQAWLASGARPVRNDLRGRLLGGYLTGLLAWCRGFRENGTGLSLERMALHPGTVSGYPELSFEMSGEPAQLGALIWNHLVEYPEWRLGSLDLASGGGAAGWWLRGSLRFAGQAGT